MTYIPPNPNGQATMANSEPVVIASNQTPIPITGTITVDTTLLSKEAKQDLILAELKLKADSTETQPVEINHNSVVVILLQELIEEQKLTNKLLNKIYR